MRANYTGMFSWTHVRGTTRFKKKRYSRGLQVVTTPTGDIAVMPRFVALGYVRQRHVRASNTLTLTFP